MHGPARGALAEVGVTEIGVTEVGVAIVPSVPHGDTILLVMFVVCFVMLALTVRYLFAEDYRRLAVFGVLFLGCAGVSATYFVQNYDKLHAFHDYPATFAALEARYGVTLDPASTAGLTFPRSGRYQTVDQERIGTVTRADGTVIEDVYVQFSTGDRQRAALVLREDGTSDLLMTKSTWWPELPVVG